jgi:hypothetical protein
MNFHYFVIFWERQIWKIKGFFLWQNVCFQPKKQKKIHFCETKELFF